MFARRRPSAAPALPAASPGSNASTIAAAPANPRRDFLARTAAALGGGLLALAGRPALPHGDQAQAATTAAEPFIGEIMLFAGNFAPNGWAMCNGQLLSIAQNTALFSLIGTYYGGDGQVTFALPDLRGRVPVHTGQGPGLPNVDLGETGGAPYHTLIAPEMPAHSHALYADSANGAQSEPGGALPARDPAGSPAYGTNANVVMAANAIQAAGGSQPHNNMQPYLGLNYCIALFGIFPPRN